MKRHFAWFKFLWSLSLVLIAFLSIAATFPKPFSFFKMENVYYSPQDKDLLMNRFDIAEAESRSEPRRFSPIETAWQSYRAVSISS